MIEPSSQTIIRCVVYYRYSFESPLERIILAHGYGTDGKDHPSIATFYGLNPKEKMYFGYLAIEGDAVRVFSLGDEELKAPQSNELTQKVERDINALPILKQEILDLFHIVAANEVSHLPLDPRPPAQT